MAGAIIGGLMTVLGSWLAQRVQAKSQWIALEVSSREQLYKDFIEAAANCYADALQHDEPDLSALVALYADVGRIRVHSSASVIRAADYVTGQILKAYLDPNRSVLEVREMLADGSIDLLSRFGGACRVELQALASTVGDRRILIFE